MSADAVPPAGRAALLVQVQLSSSVLQAGVRALLQDLGFSLAAPGTSGDLLVVDDTFLLGQGALPDLPLVVVSDAPSSQDLRSEPGLRGWALLPVDLTPAELEAAVLGAAAGLVVLSPDQLSGLLTGPTPFLEARAVPELQEPLTARERTVLDLLAQGLSNKRIALQLNISENTVKFHLGSLFGKLGVNTRAGAATRAIQLGLTFV